MLVDLFVAGPDSGGLFQVAGGIGVQHVLQPAGHEPAHAADGPGDGGERLAFGQHQGALGDVAGQVAAPLQIAGDLHAGHGAPELAADGLTGGDQLDGLTLDVGLEGVELGVARHDRLGERNVAPDDGVHAIGDLRFRQTAQPGDLGDKGFDQISAGLGPMFVHQFPSRLVSSRRPIHRA